MLDPSPAHLAILAVVIVVLFGAKRLPDAARSLGQSLRIFKAETRGLREDAAAPTSAVATAPPVAGPAPLAGPAPVTGMPPVVGMPPGAAVPGTVTAPAGAAPAPVAPPAAPPAEH